MEENINDLKIKAYDLIVEYEKHQMIAQSYKRKLDEVNTKIAEKLKESKDDEASSS